jgi:pyruvate,water dikinase
MAEPPTEWPLPDPKGKYARSSIVELMPNPLTPLFGSVIPSVISRGMRNLSRTLAGSEKVFPEEIFVLINDYGYYNFNLTASQIARLFVHIPFTLGRLLRTTEQRWRNQARPRYIAVIEHWRVQKLADLSAHDIQRAVAEILDAAIEHYSSIQTGILPVSFLTEIIFTAWYNRMVRKPDDPPALTFLLGFDSLPIRAEKSLFGLSRWVRAHPTLAAFLLSTPSDKLAARLSGSTPDHLAPDDWEGFADRFHQHLLLFGHAIYDLDFASPVPADDPVPLLETLRRYLQGQGSDPFSRQGAAAARREECEQRVQSRMHEPWRQIFLKLVGNAQKYAPLREDALSDVGLGWPEIRRMLLELGSRLAASRWITQPTDIFWLVREEVSAGATALDRGAAIPPGLNGVSDRVRERRARWMAEKQVIPPPVLPRKARWAGMDIEKFSPAGVANPALDTLKGTPGSPGVITAPACVLTGPEDFAKMQQGHILVAAITTPAWTPLFPLASGVVTDVGGLLSHSSIVAREYGIPAVLGTGTATRRIRNGMMITVDGNRGIVQLSGEE